MGCPGRPFFRSDNRRCCPASHRRRAGGAGCRSSACTSARVAIPGNDGCAFAGRLASGRFLASRAAASCCSSAGPGPAAGVCTTASPGTAASLGSATSFGSAASPCPAASAGPGPGPPPAAGAGSYGAGARRRCSGFPRGGGGAAANPCPSAAPGPSQGRHIQHPRARRSVLNQGVIFPHRCRWPPTAQ